MLRFVVGSNTLALKTTLYMKGLGKCCLPLKLLCHSSRFKRRGSMESIKTYIYLVDFSLNDGFLSSATHATEAIRNLGLAFQP